MALRWMVVVLLVMGVQCARPNIQRFLDAQRIRPVKIDQASIDHWDWSEYYCDFPQGPTSKRADSYWRVVMLNVIGGVIYGLHWALRPRKRLTRKQ